MNKAQLINSIRKTSAACFRNSGKNPLWGYRGWERWNVAQFTEFKRIVLKDST